MSWSIILTGVGMVASAGGLLYLSFTDHPRDDLWNKRRVKFLFLLVMCNVFASMVFTELLVNQSRVPYFSGIGLSFLLIVMVRQFLLLYRHFLT